jgi:diaminopimelate decarboxylase
MKIPRRVIEIIGARRGPAYIYDLDLLRDRCRELESLPIERKAIFFATMANDHPAVLRTIRDLGHGVFVNSPRHLRLAVELGFDSQRIVYAASNMTCAEFEICRELEVRLVLDSIGQLERFSGLADPGDEIAVRISVGSALEGGEIREDPLYRFGILPEEIGLALAIADNAEVRIVGAHSYFGTDLSSPRPLLDGLERLRKAAEALPDLRYLDAGGGFGIGSPGVARFDLNRYGLEAPMIIRREEARRRRDLELVLEPGRYLVAECGFFVVDVEDVKIRGDRVFVGTNGSVANFPRPLIYPDRAEHPCRLLNGPPSVAPYEHPLYICGNSTYSRDFLASGVRLPLPTPGDRIVFGNAGAYCRSMFTEFLGKERPVEIVLGGAPRRRRVPVAQNVSV